MCELLWPPPTVLSIDQAGLGHPLAAGAPAGDAQPRPATGEFILVPGLRRPPLLVPAQYHVAAAAVRHYSGQRSRAARLTTKLFSFCLDNGLGRAVSCGRITMHVPAGVDTIETYLAAVLSRNIRVSMYLGPPRANRKPVLQILSPTGQPLAFAKIGVNPLTCQLVRSERAALTRLEQAGLTGIAVPQVLHYDRWQGLDILVLSALPAWLRRRPLRPPQLAEFMGTVARMDGLRSESLAGGDYLRRLRKRLADADEGPDQARLTRALDELAARAGDQVLTYGAWHGDWAPWNMASTADGLLIWDWERFTLGVPLGFDAIHYRLQTEVGPGHRDPMAAAAACSQDAVQLLRPFGVSAGQARVTGLLYLADLATRYLSDRQAKAGARYGAPGSWLIPVINREVSRL